MIPYSVVPPLELGPISINMYGVMFAFSVLVALLIAKRDAKKRNLSVEIIYDLVLYLVVGGVIGARIFYLLFYWPDGMAMGFLDIFKIWEGGLAFFGGFIGATLVGYLYAKKKKLNFLLYADIVAIPLVAGHFFGRLGDYLTGGHPGKVTDMPWAIYLDNAFRHPVVLYEMLGLVIILIILMNLRRLKMYNGFLFASYVVLYSIQRLILDIFRIESTDPRTFGLTPSQILVVFLFIGAAGFIFRKRQYKKVKRKT